jgi:hypothetical protein
LNAPFYSQLGNRETQQAYRTSKLEMFVDKRAKNKEQRIKTMDNILRNTEHGTRNTELFKLQTFQMELATSRSIGTFQMELATSRSIGTLLFIPEFVGVRLKSGTLNFLSSGHETQKRFILQQENAQKDFVRFEVFASYSLKFLFAIGKSRDPTGIPDCKKGNVCLTKEQRIKSKE